MKKLLFSILFLLSLQFCYSQSAVYMCPRTGAVGFAYGNFSAGTAAYNSCINYGGTNPYLVASTNYKGYGVIVVGYTATGARVVGTGVGYSTYSAAFNAANNMCISYGGIYNRAEYVNWLDL